MQRTVRVLLAVALCFLAGALLATGCTFPGSVSPTVKLGLSAPFEGRSRVIGYQMLYAVRLAIHQRNQAGGVGGRYLVELVALNDFDEEGEAVLQAQKMAIDPGVSGVLGGPSPNGARRARREYDRLGLAFLTPEADLTDSPEPVEVEEPFAAEYESLSGGVPPGEASVWAYEAANRLLDAMDTVLRDGAGPLRQGVLAALELGP